jgi:hypothetical protein
MPEQRRVVTRQSGIAADLEITLCGIVDAVVGMVAQQPLQPLQCRELHQRPGQAGEQRRQVSRHRGQQDVVGGRQAHARLGGPRHVVEPVRERRDRLDAVPCAAIHRARGRAVPACRRSAAAGLEHHDVATQWRTDRQHRVDLHVEGVVGIARLAQPEPALAVRLVRIRRQVRHGVAAPGGAPREEMAAGVRAERQDHRSVQHARARGQDLRQPTRRLGRRIHRDRARRIVGGQRHRPRRRGQVRTHPPSRNAHRREPWLSPHRDLRLCRLPRTTRASVRIAYMTLLSPPPPVAPEPGPGRVTFRSACRRPRQLDR